jgi:ATP-dependent RNA helicase DDX21
MDNYKISLKTKKILKDNGIIKLFPIQHKTFDFIYNGEDLIGREKTGFGKTLAYALPIIERFRKLGYFEKKEKSRKPMVIVIVPTRELAIQVAKEYSKLVHYEDEFKVVKIYGGQPIER